MDSTKRIIVFLLLLASSSNATTITCCAAGNTYQALSFASQAMSPGDILNQTNAVTLTITALFSVQGTYAMLPGASILYTNSAFPISIGAGTMSGGTFTMDGLNITANGNGAGCLVIGGSATGYTTALVLQNSSLQVTRTSGTAGSCLVSNSANSSGLTLTVKNSYLARYNMSSNSRCMSGSPNTYSAHRYYFENSVLYNATTASAQNSVGAFNTNGTSSQVFAKNTTFVSYCGSANGGTTLDFGGQTGGINTVDMQNCAVFSMGTTTNDMFGLTLSASTNLLNCGLSLDALTLGTNCIRVSGSDLQNLNGTSLVINLRPASGRVPMTYSGLDLSASYSKDLSGLAWAPVWGIGAYKVLADLEPITSSNIKTTTKAAISAPRAITTPVWFK